VNKKQELMTSKDSRILTIGNLTVDDVVMLDSMEIFPDTIGGDALYSAVGIRIWDGSPKIAARIGRNFPKTAVDQFESFGIDSYLVNVDNNDIHEWALYERGGGRQFINQLSSGNYYQMSITDNELPDEILTMDAVHVAAMPTDVQFHILKKLNGLRKENTIISWDPHLLYLRQPEMNKMAHQMLAYVDLFLPSQEEVYAMENGDMDLMQAAEKYAYFGPEVVAIKMNTKGSLVYTKSNGHFYHIPICQSKTLDPTGAGDSYCGGFLRAYIENGDAVLSACYGTIAASYVVESRGAINALLMDHFDKEQRLLSVKQKIEKRN